MIVHAVVALVPVASAAWLLTAADVTLGRFGPALWNHLTTLSLALVLLASVPAAVTGVGERNAMYARWHRTHRLKLVLSLALTVAVGVELALLSGGSAPLLGALIVGVNNALTLWLSALGLRISLGRQGPGRASYVPDMYRDPPVDILKGNAALKAEPARVVDPSSEVRDVE